MAEGTPYGPISMAVDLAKKAYNGAVNLSALANPVVHAKALKLATQHARDLTSGRLGQSLKTAMTAMKEAGGAVSQAFGGAEGAPGKMASLKQLGKSLGPVATKLTDGMVGAARALPGVGNQAGTLAQMYLGSDLNVGQKAMRAYGTYVAGAAAVRWAKGGTMTHDENGRRDIVGVPFV